MAYDLVTSIVRIIPLSQSDIDDLSFSLDWRLFESRSLSFISKVPTQSKLGGGGEVWDECLSPFTSLSSLPTACSVYLFPDHSSSVYILSTCIFVSPYF